MSNEQQSVVVCQLLDVHEMRGVAQAALEESIALVTLSVAPPPDEFVLELHASGSRPVLLLAALAGEAFQGMCPLRVRPLDDEHYGQLLAFVCASDSGPVTRWTGEATRVGSVPRLDTLQDLTPDFRSDAPHSSPGGVDPLVGRTLAAGKYMIEALLGEGSAGAVYRGRHIALDKQLAIKVLHPRFRADATFTKRFLIEARAASRLDHPNVTHVQDFGEEPDGLLYIVMELLQGTDLRRLLHVGSLTQSRRIEILLSVLNALAAADDQGIVHRDIKPENIVIVSAHNEEGEMVEVVKVCDFGLATVKPRQTGGTDIRSAASAMSWVAGTPEYMSPEQILGERLDVRSDLYSCGVVLFEMLTGRLPFESRSVMHLLKAQLHDPPPALRSIDPTIDPRLEALTLRALSKEREPRPSTPRDFRNELRKAASATRTATVGGPLPAPMSSSVPPALGHDSGPLVLDQPLPEDSLARAMASRTADRIAGNAAAVIAELTGHLTPQQFAVRLRALAPAIPVLLERGAVAPLAALAMVLVRLANTPTRDGTQVRELCERALSALHHAPSLAPVAELLLAGPEHERDAAREVLVLAGEAGMHALVEARVKLASHELNRAGFIGTMRAFGASAYGPLTAALAQAAQHPSGGNPLLLEDLLRALPDDPQPEFLKLGQSLAHHGAVAVRRAAIVRMADIVGSPARPALRVATRDPDDSVRVAAVGSLRKIQCVDSAITALARDLLSSTVAASLELRVAVAGALQDVVPDLRRDAIEILENTVRPPSRSFMDVLRSSSPGQEDPIVVETAARSLIAIGGEVGRQVVYKRVMASKGELHDRLDRLLTHPRGTTT